MIIKSIAIAILLVFYGCYILKALSQKRSGIKTDQLGVGKTGMPKVIEIVLKICSYLIIIAEVASVILCSSDDCFIVRGIGLAIAALGAFVFIKAVVDMKSNWRAGVSEDKTDLVMNGIYAWSRNPAFLGFDLTYIGLLIAFFNIPLLIVTLVTMVFFHLQIVCVEEKFLISHFGEPYLAYQKKVGRYFGRRRNA